MIQFPVTDNGNSSHDVTIGGVVYTFKYNYNTRNQRIYLTILLEDNVIVEGLRLVDGGTPIQNYDLSWFPSMQLYVAWLNKGNTEPTLGSLGINKEFSLIGLTWDDY